MIKMIKFDNKAQGSTMMYMLLFLVIIFALGFTGIGNLLGLWFGLILQPIIGFGGSYPILTIFLAGLIVVFLSSALTNFFTDWRKMGEMQESQKAFQREVQKARREGNTNRINKLMKMQPEMLKKQQEASIGSMKSMLFLIIFIFPIFIWLRYFLAGLDHFYFTVPWANYVSLFDKPLLWQAWLWLYLIFSMIIGSIIRSGLKYVSWSNRWKNIKSKIRPSSNNV
jgi:uncharacterized membrane protein (DUF106 family)